MSKALSAALALLHKQETEIRCLKSQINGFNDKDQKENKSNVVEMIVGVLTTSLESSDQQDSDGEKGGDRH